MGRGNDRGVVAKAVECLVKIIFFRDWVKVLIFNEIRHKNCCFFFKYPIFFYLRGQQGARQEGHVYEAKVRGTSEVSVVSLFRSREKVDKKSFYD